MSHWALPENMQLAAVHEVVTFAKCAVFSSQQMTQDLPPRFFNADFKFSMTTHLSEWRLG